MTIVHTSGETEGQIYIPEVNWLLMVACIALVLGFRESSDAGRGVRHRGHRHDGDHLDPVLLRARASAGAGPLRAPAALLALFLIVRPVVLRRQLGQDRARRLVPAGGRGRRLHDHDDLEARPRRCWRAHRRRARCRSSCSSPTSSATQAAPRAGHGGVPDVDAPRDARTCCCTTSSTTRCCTSRWCSCRSSTDAVPEVRRRRHGAASKSFGHGFWARDRALRLHAEPERAGRPARAASRRACAINEADTSFYLGPRDAAR